MEYTEGLSSPSPFQQSCSPSPLLSIYTICIVIFSLQRQQRHPFITMLILSIGDRLVTCMVRAKQRNHLMFTAAASLINKHSSIREKVLEHSRANPYISVPQNPAVITGEGAGNGLFESRIVNSGIGRYCRIYTLKYDAVIAYETSGFKSISKGLGSFIRQKI